MERFLVRAPKKVRLDEHTTHDPPSRIVSWNCNSIKLRCEKRDISPLIHYLQEFNVDALFLQETRLKPEDEAACQQALQKAGLVGYNFYWNSHRSKRYSGTACIVRSQCSPISVDRTYTKLITCERKFNTLPQCENPDEEGRILILYYEHVTILNVYVPNCSWFEKGRDRRDVWDSRFESLLQNLQSKNPLLVVGDLNVCHKPLDVSHPDFFEKAMKPSNVGVSDRGLPGQPGYTQFERDNFTRLLNAADLVDTFRELHPDAQRLTWGFGASYSVGVYKNKFMGLDYFLVAKGIWLEGVVQESTICGPTHAFGSDHCCVYLHLDWKPHLESRQLADASVEATQHPSHA